MKEINVGSHNVPATARSKNYQTALATTASSGGATAPSTTTPTGGAADTAKVAQNLAEDSTDWAKILRKDIDERTENSLSIGKDITVDGKAILNDVVANTGTFAGLLKAASATITGALLASTVNATTVNATTFIGDLTGNAASATKLQTPRRIFGQSFDGTADVTGASYHTTNGYAILFGSANQHAIGSNSSGDSYIRSGGGFFVRTAGTVNLFINSLGNTGLGASDPSYKLDVNGNARISNLLSAANGGIFYGQDTFPTNIGSYVLNYVSPTYGPRVLAYDGTNYQKLSLGKLISGTNFQLELNTDGTSKFNGGLISNGIESSKGGLFYGQYATMPSGLGTYVANYVSDSYGARVLAYDGAAYKDLKLGAMPTSGIFGLSLNANGDTRVGYNIGTSNFASHTTGWNVNAQGGADFRNIYADELRVQSFTADISQALAGSDYLTKSVSKLSANFVVPAVNSTVRIIVDDIEGMPATQCFANGDYIRFRAFNRTSGLTIANVWGTVTLDTTYGSNGFLNGTQAYTFTCTQTTGAGLTVFKGSEVLDYGTSGSGLIARTTLDTMGSPYEQIATWKNDPSNGNNYTVHARLGNLNGIANCNGYGLYTDNGFFTGKVTVGDLTKTNHYLDFSNGALTVKGNIYLASGYAAVSTFDMDHGISLAVDNIHVGARNLLTDTKTFKGYTNLSLWNYNGDLYGLHTYIKYGVWEGLYKEYVVKAGREYTFSAYFACPIEANAYIFINKPGDTDIVPPKHLNSINNWARVSYTFTPSSDMTISPRIENSVDGQYVAVCGYTLIEGNKGYEDWSPAPEDVDAAISLKVSKDGIIGAINLTSEAATIQASKINLVGAVTFNSFNSDLQTSFNDKASSTSVTAAQTDATAALTRNNTMAVKLGYTDYNALASTAALGHTLIDGGKINTVLINATAVVTNGLTANCITANMISSGAVTTDKIYAGAVTATTIAAGAVTTDKLYAGSITADKIAANSITSDKVNMSEFTASNGFVDSFNANVIATKRLNVAKIVADGIAAQTIDAKSATISNLNVVNATVSGTLSGVSGTFNYLKATGSSGRLIFANTYGSLAIEDDDFIQQGNKNHRSLRFLSSDIRCRGSFGAYNLNMARVHGTYIDYYVNGDTDSCVRFNLESNGIGGYYISLYSPSLSNYVSTYGNAVREDAGGFPVDILIFDNDSVYHYELSGATGKKVTVINAHDGTLDAKVYLAVNGNLNWEVLAGKAESWVNIRELMNPLVSSSVHGAGWLMISEFDNNWA